MCIHSHYSFLPRIPHHAQRMPARGDLAVEGTREVRQCAGYRYSNRSCRAGHMHARTKRMALFENPVLATNAEGTREDQCSIGVHWHVHGKVDAVWRTSYSRLMTPYNPHTTTSLIGLLTEDYGGIIPLSKSKHLVPDVVGFPQTSHPCNPRTQGFLFPPSKTHRISRSKKHISNILFLYRIVVLRTCMHTATHFHR
mgnify:CR=1 FL=1